METWYIDDERRNRRQTVAFLRRILTPGALAATGGLLFKVVVDDAGYIGLRPWFRDGQRCHHYDIDLTGPETRHLIGTLVPGGTMTLLFKNADITDNDVQSYRRSFHGLAGLFADAAPKATWPLDMVTRQIFESAGVFHPAPTHLSAQNDR